MLEIEIKIRIDDLADIKEKILSQGATLANERHETEVKNEKHLRKILKSLGLQPVFQYSKFRTVFRKKRLTICLDETPIGDFLELEGQQSEIVRFADTLNFSKKDFIKLDYVQLIQRKKGS
jgi:adenylate cyclase class 2